MNRNLPLLESPATILHGIAARAKAARLRREWSREELARRAGVSAAMIRDFERTGHIGLVRLLALAGALGALAEFSAVLPTPPARSLEDLEPAGPVRKRGRTTTAASGSGGDHAR